MNRNAALTFYPPAARPGICIHPSNFESNIVDEDVDFLVTKKSRATLADLFDADFYSFELGTTVKVPILSLPSYTSYPATVVCGTCGRHRYFSARKNVEAVCHICAVEARFLESYAYDHDDLVAQMVASGQLPRRDLDYVPIWSRLLPIEDYDIEIEVVPRNAGYYSALGYECAVGNTIKVSSLHVMPGGNRKLSCKCAKCGETAELQKLRRYCHICTISSDEPRAEMRDVKSATYRNWRTAVYTRDGYACVKCGDKRGGNLEAHHIVGVRIEPELEYDTDNGVSLCSYCHSHIHRAEYCGQTNITREAFDAWMGLPVNLAEKAEWEASRNVRLPDYYPRSLFGMGSTAAWEPTLAALANIKRKASTRLCAGTVVYVDFSDGYAYPMVIDKTFDNGYYLAYYIGETNFFPYAISEDSLWTSFKLSSSIKRRGTAEAHLRRFISSTLANDSGLYAEPEDMYRLLDNVLHYFEVAA